jgi:adenylylsulfate kinase
LMVYVKASFETCQKRDVKGLYKKAASGEIKNFTGMGSDYEVPQAQNLTLDTENNSAEECVKVLLEKLKSLDI